MIEAGRVAAGSPEEARLRSLVEEHVRETGSAYGSHVLAHWDEARDLFWHVVPNTTPLKRDSQAMLHVPNWSRRLTMQVPTPPRQVLTTRGGEVAASAHAAAFSTAAGSPAAP